MKILAPKSAANGNGSDFVKESLAIAKTKRAFVDIIKQRLSKADKSDFYPNVCVLFNYIGQAFENKIVLLSRKFYPTTTDTTSLSVAFDYPPVRSDVFELVDDIYKSSGFNIGMIDVGDLANLTYDVAVNKKKINWNYLNTLRGCLDYESSFA